MADIQDLGISVLSLTQGFTAFTLFMPKLQDVREASSGDMKVVHNVRMGEIAAAGVTVGIGALLSALTKSNGPIIISAVVAAGFTVLYESTLHGIKGGGDLLQPTREDPTNVSVARNEPGDLRTYFPLTDSIDYDMDRLEHGLQVKEGGSSPTPFGLAD